MTILRILDILQVAGRRRLGVGADKLEEVSSSTTNIEGRILIFFFLASKPEQTTQKYFVYVSSCLNSAVFIWALKGVPHKTWRSEEFYFAKLLEDSFSPLTNHSGYYVPMYCNKSKFPLLLKLWKCSVTVPLQTWQ